MELVTVQIGKFVKNIDKKKNKKRITKKSGSSNLLVYRV